MDIYSLAESLLGVILSSQNPDRITQLIWKLNQKTETVECIFERRVSFTGIYNCRLGITSFLTFATYFFLGIGTVDSGYIQLLGKNSIENGDGLVTKIIAANPMLSEQYPDISFDKEVSLYFLGLFK